MMVILGLAMGLAAFQDPTTTSTTAATTAEPVAVQQATDSPFAVMASEALRVHPVPRDDEPDQVRRMAATDRDEDRFFNRPGATPEQYDREWNQCRQIARRLASSRSSGAAMSAGFVHGGLAGGLIAGGLDAAFSERRARRDIRRQCLMARGWRMIEPDEQGRQRIAALPREERRAWFDRMIGADQLEAGATVTDWAAFTNAGAAKLGEAGEEE